LPAASHSVETPSPQAGPASCRQQPPSPELCLSTSRRSQPSLQGWAWAQSPVPCDVPSSSCWLLSSWLTPSHSLPWLWYFRIQWQPWPVSYQVSSESRQCQPLLPQWAQCQRGSQDLRQDQWYPLWPRALSDRGKILLVHRSQFKDWDTKKIMSSKSA
jgi:hypothetical protein